MMTDDLRARLIGVLILLPVALIIFMAPQLWFNFLMSMVCLYAAWEYYALFNIMKVVATPVALLTLLGLSLGCFIVYMLLGPLFVLVCSCVFWLMAVVNVIQFQVPGRMRLICLHRSWFNILMPAIYIFPAWVAMDLIRVHSILPVLWLVVLVAAADVGAYFVGRRYGKRKLIPTVSPGKTIEGVLGGLCLAILCCLPLVFMFNLSAILNMPSIFICCMIPILAMLSVVGDLFESALKRCQGVKDSGRILPGHGGLLDRVDGYLATLPFFALSVLCFQG